MISIVCRPGSDGGGGGGGASTEAASSTAASPRPICPASEPQPAASMPATAAINRQARMRRACHTRAGGSPHAAAEPAGVGDSAAIARAEAGELELDDGVIPGDPDSGAVADAERLVRERAFDEAQRARGRRDLAGDHATLPRQPQVGL